MPPKKTAIINEGEFNLFIDTVELLLPNTEVKIEEEEVVVDVLIKIAVVTVVVVLIVIGVLVVLYEE